MLRPRFGACYEWPSGLDLQTVGDSGFCAGHKCAARGCGSAMEAPRDGSPKWGGAI